MLRSVSESPALQLSGVPHVQVGGKRLPLPATDALLLALLALEGPTPREKLAALLWPGSGDEAARNALRQRLFRLRKQAGVDLIENQGLGCAGVRGCERLQGQHDTGQFTAGHDLGQRP